MLESNNKSSIEKIASKTYLPTDKESDAFDKVGYFPFKSSAFQSSLY